MVSQFSRPQAEQVLPKAIAPSATAITTPTAKSGTATIPYPDRAVEAEVLRRFFANALLDEHRVGRDAGRIAEEIIQHLTDVVGAQVEIIININARFPDGASDQVIRTVTENCKTLRFQTYGFEPN